MSYGLTIEQVRQIRQPQPAATAWGSIASLTEMPHFCMFRVEIQARQTAPLQLYRDGEFQAFVETGEVVLRSLDEGGRPQAGLLRRGEIATLSALLPHAFGSNTGAVLYLFGKRNEAGLRPVQIETHEAAASVFRAIEVRALPPIGHATTDVREKYWGRIETILSGEIAAKRIFVRKGGQSSLEYHVEKSESYYIHSGVLKVGLRVGRAENRSILMMPGQSYDVRPGVMHMRMGIEDTVILEVSTRDSDSDSYLVEDGQTYRHVDIDSTPSLTAKQEQPA